MTTQTQLDIMVIAVDTGKVHLHTQHSTWTIQVSKYPTVVIDNTNQYTCIVYIILNSILAYTKPVELLCQDDVLMAS